MSSRTDAINRALLKVGTRTVTSEDEGTVEAVTARAIFGTLCLSELRKHAWSFAKARVQLAALSTAPAFGWTYAYQLPDDFVRVVQVGQYYDFASIRGPSSESITPYTIEGKMLYSNDAAPLRLIYIKDMCSDPAQWDAMFFEAFAASLAVELCEPLSKQTGKKESLKRDYMAIIKEARRVNAIELPPVPLPDNSWVTTRFT